MSRTEGSSSHDKVSTSVRRASWIKWTFNDKMIFSEKSLQFFSYYVKLCKQLNIFSVAPVISIKHQLLELGIMTFYCQLSLIFFSEQNNKNFFFRKNSQLLIHLQSLYDSLCSLLQHESIPFIVTLNKNFNVCMVFSCQLSFLFQNL